MLRLVSAMWSVSLPFLVLQEKNKGLYAYEEPVYYSAPTRKE